VRHHEFTSFRPFFCQIEAVETVIWLTEVAPHSKAGRRILQRLAADGADCITPREPTDRCPYCGTRHPTTVGTPGMVHNQWGASTLYENELLQKGSIPTGISGSQVRGAGNCGSGDRPGRGSPQMRSL